MVASERRRVAVIGAGASGLSAARQAMSYGCEVVIFEKLDRFGGIWHNNDDPNARSLWEGLCTQHSRQFCGFSDFPMSNVRNAHFASRAEVLQYLCDYVNAFDIERLIRYQTKVINIQRTPDWLATGKWIVRFQQKDKEPLDEEFEAVLVCSGFYACAYRPPQLRMENKFNGRIIHSSMFRSPAEYAGKRVVVVGFGNSAISIACALAPVARQIHLSSRRNALLIGELSRSGGIPWDVSYNTQFSALARRIVPKCLRNISWTDESLRLCDYSKYNMQPMQKFTAVHLTFAGALPYYLAKGRIKMARRLLSFTEDGRGVQFEDKTTVNDIDEIIFCTGYTFDFPFVENGELIRIFYNDFHLYKHMFLPLLSPHNNFAVIGHLQPTGPLFPVVEMQSRFFFHSLTGRFQLPSPAKMKSKLERKRCDMSLNFVKTQRYTQIEDYVNYMNDLAESIGCQPSLRQILRGGDIKLATCCFFGPTTSHQYRLCGPNAWPSARLEIFRHNAASSLWAAYFGEKTCVLLTLLIAFILLRLFKFL